MQDIIRITVEGIGQGLLMHNPAAMRASEAERRGSAQKTIPTAYDEAKAALYVARRVPGIPDGSLYANADWFREAGLISAADFKDPTRKGRTTMTRRFGASVFLAGMEYPLLKPDGTTITEDDGNWEIYTKRAVVQRQGILRSRALIREWTCAFDFEYDTDTIEVPLIAAIINQAGKYPGVGDYRPGKKGPFGRYRVASVNGEAFSATGQAA